MIKTNEIANVSTQLPDTLEDLTQFVLVGKAKLNAYMLKLKTVNKLSIAQEIRDQTLQETQEISNALIAAEQRIGELLLNLPTAQGRRNDLTSVQDGTEVKTKDEKAADMGYTHRDVVDYQQMAKYPEVVQKVMDDAVAKGEVVTKASVMREIKFYKDRIAELEKSKKETVTKTVEVVPDDYNDLKRKAEMSDVHEKDFRDMQKRYEEMAEKWKTAEAEKEKLIAKSKEPEEQTKEEIKRSALLFCAGVANFIEKYGGYVWLTEHINEMGKNEKKGYLSAINAVESWVYAIKKNMEGIIQ